MEEIDFIDLKGMIRTNKQTYLFGGDNIKKFQEEALKVLNMIEKNNNSKDKNTPVEAQER